MAKDIYDILEEFQSQSQTCPRCGGQMTFQFSDEWECQSCGCVGESEMDGDGNGWHIYITGEGGGPNVDDMPECCKACGGPYPDCMSSCKIFDD